MNIYEIVYYGEGRVTLYAQAKTYEEAIAKVKQSVNDRRRNHEVQFGFDEKLIERITKISDNPIL